MEDKDIVGKTFTAFEFDRTKGLRYGSQYKESFGRKAEVLYLHDNLAYAYCSIKINSTTTIQNFYPTEMIKEQLEEKEAEENMSIEQILNNMKKLTEELWKQKI